MKAIDIIKRFEGFRTHAYQDDVGVWTVGYGATGPSIKAGVVWTPEQAEADLQSRVDVLLRHIHQVVRRPMTENQEAAFTSLAYNIGFDGFSRSSALSAFNAGLIPQAADNILKWDMAGGKVNPGLVKRRAEEREIFLTP